MAAIEDVLVPLYMHHRYQVDAAASMLGGLDYIYAFRGDGRDPLKRVSGDAQRSALSALLGTLDPAALMVPRSVIDMLPPRPPGYGRTREQFPRYTGSAFDAVTPAVVAADHTLAQMLQPSRAARLVEQHALDPSLPGLDEVLSALASVARPAANESPYQTEVRLAVVRVIADRVMALAAGASMPHVRAIATQHLANWHGAIMSAPPPETEAAFVSLVARDIERFLERPAETYAMPGTPAAPPGAPIGDPAMEWLTSGSWWTEAGPSGWAEGWLGHDPNCSLDFYH